MKRNRTVWWIALAIVALVACSKEKKKSPAEDDTNASRPGPVVKKGQPQNLTAPDFFKLIPADSPMVMASYEPLPEAFMMKMGEMMSPYRDLMLNAIAESGKPGAEALKTELTRVLTREGLESIGVDITPRFAMYMIGASVELRYELADGDKFRDYLLSTIEKQLGSPLPTKKMGDVTYWESPPFEAAIVVGVSKDALMIGAMPSALKDTVVPMLFGQKAPAKSIADTKVLDKIAADYGMGSMGVGYLDTVAIAKMFTQGAPGLQGTPLDLSATLSPVCRGEIEEMVGVMPKMYFGYESLDAKKMSMLIAIELRGDIAAAMSSMAAPVPGWSVLKDRKSFMTFGMGVKARAAIEWIKMLGTKVQGAPYQCPELNGLNQALISMGQGVGMAPSMVNEIGGFVATMDSFSPMKPSEIRGALGVAIKEPGPLMSLISGFVPGLSGVKLESNGKAKAVDLSAIGSPAPVSVAQGPHMLGFSMGADSETLLSKLVMAPEEKSGPFFVMQYDYARFMDSLPLDNPGSNPAFVDAMKKAMKSFGILRMEMFATKPGLLGRYVFEMN